MCNHPKSVASPVLWIFADILAIGRELLFACYDLVPVVELPQVFAYVLYQSGAAHLAVDVAGSALEAAQEKTEVVFLIRGAVVDAQDCMEVVRHKHEFVKFEFGILCG